MVASIHEAAHAVIARHYRYLLVSIEIGIDGSRLGHTPFDPVLPDGKTEEDTDIRIAMKLYRQNATVCLAGPIAQEMYGGHPAFDGAGSDILEAGTWAIEFGQRSPKLEHDNSSVWIHACQLLQNATMDAIELLKREDIRTAIETVAGHLRREGRLSGERAVQIIDSILARDVA